jgi:hypothetical protein
MPHIEITTAERMQCDQMIRFVRANYDELSDNAKAVFGIMFVREFQEDLKTIANKRKAKAED